MIVSVVVRAGEAAGVPTEVVSTVVGVADGADVAVGWAVGGGVNVLVAVGEGLAVGAGVRVAVGRGVGLGAGRTARVVVGTDADVAVSTAVAPPTVIGTSVRVPVITRAAWPVVTLAVAVMAELAPAAVSGEVTVTVRPTVVVIPADGPTAPVLAWAMS